MFTLIGDKASAPEKSDDKSGEGIARDVADSAVW
jgi:hypothetical protein